MGGLSYYRKRLNDKAKRIQSITSLLKQGVKFVFTPALETIVRERLAEMSTPPIIVYPNWNAVSDNFRPFLLHCDAGVDGVRATLEQGQDDYTIRPIVFIRRTTIESERHWTPLDLQAGRIVWSIQRLRGYLWGNNFHIFLYHKALEGLDMIAEHNP